MKTLRIERATFRMDRATSRMAFVSLSYRFRMDFQAAKSSVFTINKGVAKDVRKLWRKNTVQGQGKPVFFITALTNGESIKTLRIERATFRMDRATSRMAFVSLSYRFRMDFQAAKSPVLAINKGIAEDTRKLWRKNTVQGQVKETFWERYDDNEG